MHAPLNVFVLTFTTELILKSEKPKQGHGKNNSVKDSLGTQMETWRKKYKVLHIKVILNKKKRDTLHEFVALFAAP